jgi:diamine N-acetyltransferase
MYTSYSEGEGSPEGFYKKLGFVPTGDHYGEEIEVVYRLDHSGSQNTEKRVE